MRKLKSARPLTAMLILLPTVLIGCVSRQPLPEVSVKNTSQCKYYQEQKDVRVAVDPYLEEERLFEFFGDDLLLSYGLLPVHVVVENNAKEPLLIQKENIRLITSENKTIAQEPPAYAKMPMAKKRMESDLAYGIGTILFPLPGLLLSPVVMKYDADLRTVMQNISAKSIYDKSIYQGEQHHGFAYFMLKDNIPKDVVPKVQVEVKNLATNETYTFTFDVDLNAVKRKTAEVKHEE